MLEEIGYVKWFERSFKKELLDLINYFKLKAIVFFLILQKLSSREFLLNLNNAPYYLKDWEVCLRDFQPNSKNKH